MLFKMTPQNLFLVFLKALPLQTLLQDGKVWFLAGAPINTENPVVRECTVPAGKFLYFPLVNAAWITGSSMT